MGRYRHKVTGFVGEYPDDYAEWVGALERVGDDEVLTEEDCGCGPEVELPEQVDEQDYEVADEPLPEHDEFFIGEIRE